MFGFISVITTKSKKITFEITPFNVIFLNQSAKNIYLNALGIPNILFLLTNEELEISD